MADGTLIEWARHPITGLGATWNPITGCALVSPGCTNCYAMQLAGTRLKNHESRKGLTMETKSGPVWNGEIRFNTQWLDQPLCWKKPRGIFVCAHGDLFAEGVTDDMLDLIFGSMAMSPQHIFFVLTKRPMRMRDYLTQDRPAKLLAKMAKRDQALKLIVPGTNVEHLAAKTRVRDFWPLPNVWLGVSVEDQPRADERIPILLDTPAAIRFISAEPLLGPVDLTMIPTGGRIGDAVVCDSALRDRSIIAKGDCLDWVIAGGESGPKARPSHPDWFRSLRDQSAAADVPFFFKQWGEWSEAPWKFAIGDQESVEAYKERSEALCATHAVPRWSASAQELDHKAWSVERVLPKPFTHAGIRRIGKRAAGHLLDGKKHLAFPEVRP